MPPMNIKVRDNRSFGRKPVVGLCSLKSLERYRREPRDQIDGPDSQGTAMLAQTCRAHSLNICSEHSASFYIQSYAMFYLFLDSHIPPKPGAHVVEIKEEKKRKVNNQFNRF